MLKLTNTKVIISGSIIEAYLYNDRPLTYGYNVPNHNRERTRINVVDEASKLRKIESRKRSMRRAGANIRKLINANAWQWKTPNDIPYAPVSVTLTFRDDITDVDIANTEFHLFIRRLNYIASGGAKKCHLKYVSIIEFQDKNRPGVAHYHVVFFNLPDKTTELISDIWGHGFVDVKNVKDISNIGAYLSKYLSQASNDNRLDDHKRYFSSRGLIQATEVRDQNIAQDIIKQIPKEYLSESSCFDGYQGGIRCVKYKLNKYDTLFDILPELPQLLWNTSIVK